MIITLLVISFFGVGGYLFMNHPKFGRLPQGERLERIKKSPNYKNGQFQNQSETPSFTEGATMFTVLRNFLFQKSKRAAPKNALPSKKTNLHQLDPHENVLVWFGHSSYFMQLDGKKILVDPVFSGSASPVPSGTKAFKGTNIYGVDDMPEIDFLFLSHDHWDHLDYDSIRGLKPKIKQIICGLGTAAHLEYWGYDKNIIIEEDWGQAIPLEGHFRVHTVPARHFSGRGFKRNQVLWTSFVLQTPNFKIFIGGDSGYDFHFTKIGEKFGPLDLAILENGQYNKYWKYIHMHPKEVVKAAKDLKAKKLFPVHNSKFSLSLHDWDEPLLKIYQHNTSSLQLMTPIIGQKVDLNEEQQSFSNWWENIE